MKGKTAGAIPFPVAVNTLNHYKLPLLGRKKRKPNTKNPFKTKVYLIPDDTIMSVKTLDGFLLIRLTQNDIPHEILRADLSRKRIHQSRPEDFIYFINLEELDVSENQLKIEDLQAFPALKTLKISANGIKDIQLMLDNKFERLTTLDLSFNYLTVEAVKSLENIIELQTLMLVNNELQELPDDMSNFRKLQKLDVSDNNFNSKHKPQELWYTLGVIPNLKDLNISKNFLRGIHVGKLQIGHFQRLEYFDFSYNMAENQHNLICARNFLNLRTIIITGNPFGILREHQGLEMEVHARTGAILINEETEKPYLKKVKPRKPPVKYEQLKRVEDDIFKLPLVEKEEEEQIFDDVEPMFVTENQQRQHHQSQKIKASTPVVRPKNYDQFKQMAQEVLGEAKEYEVQNTNFQPVHDLTTAYQKLKNALSKPDQPDYQDFEEPNYMKPTVSIPRYKYVNNDEDQLSSIQREFRPTDQKQESFPNDDIPYEIDVQLIQ